MRLAPVVTEIATSHFPPRQTPNFLRRSRPFLGHRLIAPIRWRQRQRSPARLARLPNGVAVILVRKSVAAAAAALPFAATPPGFAPAVSPAAAIAAETAAAIPSARRTAAFASWSSFVHLEL